MTKMRQCITYFCLTLLAILSTQNAYSYQFNSGMREELEEKGINWNIVYAGEFWSNVDGGIKEDETYLGNFDFTLTLDTEKVGLWPNGTFFVYFLDNHGGEKLTGEIVGDLQTISNIEAPRTSRLYQIWYEHFFNEDQFSVLFGIHDYNSDFAVTEYGGLFINSSFGISPDISSSARPSIFPLAAPAVRFKLMPTEEIEWLLGIYDGDPGDPESDEHYPRSRISSSQGAFIASELIYNLELDSDGEKLPGAYKFGVWKNTGDFDDVVDTNPSGDAIVRDNNIGAYVIIDQMVYREGEDQGLGLFLQIGGNAVSVNEVDFYFGGGLHYLGLIPGRDNDEAGIAVGYASISDDIVDAGGRNDSETVLELTYKYQLNENISIQPDVQFVFNPGADPALDDSITAGIRFEVGL